MAAPTAFPTTLLTPDSGLLDPAGSAPDIANGNTIVRPNSVRPQPPLESLIVRIANSGGSGITATFAAGVTPPAYSPKELVATIPAGSTRWVGPFSSDRFAQLGSTIAVQFSDDTDVLVTVFSIPAEW